MDRKQFNNGRRQMISGAMAETVDERPDRQDECLLSVWVPKSLHYEVRLSCVERGITIKAFVMDAVLGKLKGRC